MSKLTDERRKSNERKEHGHGYKWCRMCGQPAIYYFYCKRCHLLFEQKADKYDFDEYRVAA